MKIALTILSFLIASNLLAQSIQQRDVALLQQAFVPSHKVPLGQQYALTNDNPNELQAVLSGLFLFYKAFLSSQDNQRCSFYPSCSEYGLQAVKKLGLVRGVISTFDRLSRCNGFSPELYEKDMEHLRLKDPVGW